MSIFVIIACIPYFLHMCKLFFSTLFFIITLKHSGGEKNDLDNSVLGYV